MKTYIKTARDQVAVRKVGGNYQRFIEAACDSNWPGATVNWVTKGVAYAEVSNSSWIVRCPYCPNAVVHQPGAAFYCPNCLMQGNGGYAMTVVYPEQREQIEAVLCRRPSPNNRNWFPYETVDELIAQNMEHGIDGMG